MRRLLFLVTVLLTGCATVPPPARPGLDWQARLADAEALGEWRMTGRVAVVVGEDGGSAAVDWHQAAGVSDVALTGPLGVGSLRAVFDGGGLLLEDGHGDRLRDAEAEAVLYARLGAPVPFDHLRYWLLGAPAPGERFQPSPQASAEAGFEQSGWAVAFSRFEPVEERLLPARLTVSREGTRVKLVVTRWDLQP